MLPLGRNFGTTEKFGPLAKRVSCALVQGVGDSLMTHLEFVVLVVLDCAGIGVVDTAVVVDTVDVVGVQLV